LAVLLTHVDQTANPTTVVGKVPLQRDRSLRRRIELIATWSVDRLGRGLPDLVGFLTDLHSLEQSTPSSAQCGHHHPGRQGLFQMTGPRRVRSGYDPRACESGTGACEGPGQDAWEPPVGVRKVESSGADLRSGRVGIIKLANLHGVGVGTLQRIKMALTA
jgi:hypothetical protein